MKKGIELKALRILPDDLSLNVEQGMNLLEALASAGIRMNARCGGTGACGKCKVLIKDGTVTELEGKSPKLTAEEIEKGMRLACRCEIDSDLIVEVPTQSRVKGLSTSEKEEVQGRFHVPMCKNEDVLAGTHEPPVRKFLVEMTPPSLTDNIGDLTRLLGAIRRQHGLDIANIDFAVLQQMPPVLRDSDWKVTASVLCEGSRCEDTEEGCTFKDCRHLRIIKLEPGDTTGSLYAVAVDVGTTSIHVEIIDVLNRKRLAKEAEYNGQTAYGEDVISRIVYSLKEGHMESLQKAAAGTVNDLLPLLFEKTGINASDISFVTAAGNTTMTQLLAGINSKYIREAPYVPTVNALPWLRASDTCFDLEPGTPVYMLPGVASYVGGDIVSGIMGYGLARRDELTLYLDLGTNGEVVVGNKDWMMTASASAGPALEGGGLQCGMRAAAGAVQDFYIDAETLKPVVLTIGNEGAAGFCGSGVIALIAELVRFGIIAQNGKFNPDAKTDRVRKGESGLEYVIVKAEHSATGEDIIITEPDLDNIIRAKAAVYAACKTLIEHVGLTFDMIERVVLTGSFGNYIDIQSAIFIGLLPDVPLERYCFIKNGSLLGARLATYSTALIAESENIAKSMTNVELSEDPGFMDAYMAAMFLPHTDAALFPTVNAELKKIEEAMK